MPRRALPRLALILSLLLPPVGLAAQQADTETWDYYALGIHLAELNTAPHGYTIRRKDPAANAWLAPRTAAAGDVAADSAFLLQGAIARLPARLASLRAAGWAEDRAAVAWPDAETVYVPGDVEVVVVDGAPKPARRWVARDESDPLDVIVDLEGRVVAAMDVNSDLVLVRRGWEDATTVGRWRRANVSPAEHGYRGLGKQMVPLRDGTRLATLVYLPDGPRAQAPFPVVFIRTPYGIGGLIGNYWHYAARGYAVVLQAVRGTAYWDPEHRSEGEWGWFRNEAADGADALAWVASQPWSNGEVCTQGGSYLGYTQWNQTIAGDPALKCTIPEVSMGTVFSDQPYWGGGFVEGVAYYVTWMLDKHPIREGLSWTEVLHHRPLIDIDEFATGEDLPAWNALLENWVNGAYWAPQNWYAADVPRDFSAFQISGWWDDDFPGTMANWALMRETSDAPQRLLIGPWKHGYNADRALNGFSFGPTAVREDVWLLKQMWYDRHLKGMDNGVTDRVVDYFVLGDDAWSTASDWPPPEAEPTPFYLRSDGDAEGPMTSGRLTRSAPTSPEPFDEWVYDPAHPVTNWMSFDQMTRWEDQQTWPYDFKDIETRPDVATYTSDPLAEPLTIAGDLMLVLHASTDVRDTDWWVHVSDVAPDGTSVRITTGVLRARFRNRDDPQYGALGENYAREELLSGDIGDVVEYRIGLRSIANTFKAGHRVRVAVYNALDNYEFPNSNTGGDEARVTETIPGTMRVHHAPGRASHILLPVLPAARRAAADPHPHARGPTSDQALVSVERPVGGRVVAGDSGVVTADPP